MHRLRGRFPASARLRVVLILNPPDRRRRDVDNYSKGLLDAFTHAGIWADDEQIDELLIRKCHPVPPRGLVEVDVAVI